MADAADSKSAEVHSSCRFKSDLRHLERQHVTRARVHRVEGRPIEAAREGIQGTVKLDVTVNRDGSVKDIRAISGPVMLMSAAATAVRGWRYQQTLVGGHGVEAREYVTVVFRIAAQ